MKHILFCFFPQIFFVCFSSFGPFFVLQLLHQLFKLSFSYLHLSNSSTVQRLFVCGLKTKGYTKTMNYNSNEYCSCIYTDNTNINKIKGLWQSSTIKTIMISLLAYRIWRKFFVMPVGSHQNFTSTLCETKRDDYIRHE